MAIDINGNILSGSIFDLTGNTIDLSTIVTDGLLVWLDPGYTSSYYSSGTYYDCGYGCQYYSSNPGCTNCNTQIKDLSGNGHDGVLTNGASISYGNGVGGGVMNFVSSGSQYVDIGINAYNLGIRRSATFCGWMRSTTGGAAYLVSDWNSVGMTLSFNSSSSTDFYVYGANHRITYSYTFNTNQWYHLVGIMDGANMYMYINGVYVASQTLAEDIGSSGSTLKIGCRGDNTSYSDQQVACLQIYNKALILPEVVQNFNAGRKRFGI